MNSDFTNYNANVYHESRPSYPLELIETIKEYAPKFREINSIEIGAGTGKFSKLLLREGFKNLTCIEPNNNMLNYLEASGGYRLINCSCENIPIENESFDLFFFAQSLHWFCNLKAREEIERLSKPNSKYFVVWNELFTNKNKSTEQFKYILQSSLSTEKRIIHDYPQEYYITKMFDCNSYIKHKYIHSQDLTFSGLFNRYLSSSMSHGLSKNDLDDVKLFLKKMFDNNECEGRVRIWYECTLYVV